MAKIRVPKKVREDLVRRVELVISDVVAAHAAALSDELRGAPYDALSEAERGTWLLRRELQKAIQQQRLKQDGGKARRAVLRQHAVGQPCPRSGQVMESPSEIELEHDEYDGRPPVAVHRGWHKKAQPH